MTLQLSDAKYIQASVSRSTTPKRAERPDVADLSRIRGMADRRSREAHILMPGLDGAFEPVSFVDPTSHRRIYGFLAAVLPDGNARVEMGDGKYAVVPPSELRRMGHREDPEAVRAQLRRAIGQVSTDTNGVRADLHETQSLLPLSADDETLKLLSLSYAASIGAPTDDELYAYISRNYPGARVVEADASMPGRIGVALQVEAEMGPVAGGEVTETLDPSEVVDGEKREAQWYNPNDPLSFANRMKKKLTPGYTPTEQDVDTQDALDTANGAPDSTTHIGPMTGPAGRGQPGGQLPVNTQNRTTKLVPGQQGGPGIGPTGKHDFRSVGESLAKSGRTDLKAKAIQSYVSTAAGARFLANSTASFNGTTLLQAAMPVVYRTNPSLWKSIVQAVGNQSASMPEAFNQVQTPQMPGLPMEPAVNEDQTPAESQIGKPPGEGVSGEDPFAGNVVSAAVGARRSSIFEKAAAKSSPEPKTPGLQPAPRPAESKGGFEHLTSQGLPPSMTDVWKGMKLYRFARRGDYIMAKVEWDPAAMKGRTPHAIKTAVQHFVTAKAGASAQGANFGIIGKVYVLSINEKKGEAQVQFASEFAGMAPTVVTSE